MWTPRVLTCFNCKVILVQILEHRLLSVASFAGSSRLQLLIACRCRNGGGRSGRKSPVHDIRQMRERRCPIVVTHKLCIDQPQVNQTSCIDAVFLTLQSQVLGQDITRRTSRFFVGHHPPSRLPLCLPDITHVTLPGLPLPFLHTASDQKLEPGMAWERPGNEATVSEHMVSMVQCSKSILMEISLVP